MAAAERRRAGAFITLEGGEGAGKSTQLRALAERLRSINADVTCTREPGGTPLGEHVRRILLDLPSEGRPPPAPLTEALLFIAARAELAATVITPALERGTVVLCDRFAHSTLAYQGYGRGVDLALLQRLNADATGGLLPDLTVLLDVPADAGLARAVQDDRFGREELAFHERVRDGYLALAAKEPARWLVVDAGRSPDEVTAAIWPRIEALVRPSA